MGCIRFGHVRWQPMPSYSAAPPQPWRALALISTFTCPPSSWRAVSNLLIVTDVDCVFAEHHDVISRDPGKCQHAHLHVFALRFTPVVCYQFMKLIPCYSFIVCGALWAKTNNDSFAQPGRLCSHAVRAECNNNLLQDMDGHLCGKQWASRTFASEGLLSGFKTCLQRQFLRSPHALIPSQGLWPSENTHPNSETLQEHGACRPARSVDLTAVCSPMLA